MFSLKKKKKNRGAFHVSGRLPIKPARRPASALENVAAVRWDDPGSDDDDDDGKCPSFSCGHGSKLNLQVTAVFSPWFHLPGFHVGHIFLTHSHVNVSVLHDLLVLKKATRKAASHHLGAPPKRTHPCGKARRRICHNGTCLR